PPRSTLFPYTTLFRSLSAFTDVDEKGVAADDSVVLPEAKAYDLCDNLPEVLDRTLGTFFDADVVNAHLFEILRERFNDNAFRARSEEHTSELQSRRDL